MKNKPLVLRLKVWMQVLIVLTVGIYAVSQYYLNYRYISDLNIRQINQLNRIITSDLKTMMQFPLAVNDIQRITRITSELLQHEMIWAIEVRNEQGVIIERVERKTDNNNITLKRETIEIYDDRPQLLLDATAVQPDKTNELLGVVYLYFTNDSQVQSINRELQLQTLIFAAVVSVATLLLASFIMNYSRYVRSTISEMEKIIRGNYDIKIRRTRVEEFNTLGAKLEDVAKAFSVQVDTLTQSQSDAKKKQLEAEESNSAKIRFMQIISHEIRSPVHVIVNLFSTITRDIKRNQITSIETKLALCKESASELLAVIDELLDVQAFESGSVNLKNTEQSVNQTLIDICNRFQKRFAAKKLNFECQEGRLGNDYQALFDKGKIHRVLSNLIENAFKYTQKGAVSVSWQIQDTIPGSLVIKVMDSGIGISEGDQSHIFEQFYQVNAPEIRRQSGRGLGLSIVKELTQILQGSIDVSSVPRRGSTFTVTIPIQVTKMVSNPDLSDVSYLDSGCKVLVIDDREANCIVMMDMLNQFDITPEYATDPNAGLHKALRKQFDVILVDYHMPDLDGATLTKAIRDSEINANSVILCITADATIATQDVLIGTKYFDGVIVKPINAETLAEKIENAMYAKEFSGRVVYSHFNDDKRKD
jgi:signal transduction histidine kinase/ActR/RegA family two-component response regulator